MGFLIFVYKLKKIIGCFRKIYTLYLFHDLITGSILIQMISNFNRMCRNNSKFYIWCLNAFSTLVNGIFISEKKKHKTLSIEFWVNILLKSEIIWMRTG